MTERRVPRFAMILLALTALSTHSALGEARPVSPGEPNGESTVASTCPTFSWTADAGAAGYVIEVSRVDEPRSGAPMLVREIDGPALSWTPALEECFEPGASYSWVVRARQRSNDDEPAVSVPLYFRVAAGPSLGDVERALEILRAWNAEGGKGGAAGSAPQRRASGSAGAARGAARRASTVAPTTTAAIDTAPAAVRGNWPTEVGSSYGVAGVNQSASGAGVAAANTSGGTDLLLEGASHGEVDTRLTESGIDRTSTADQTFALTNSDALGTLSLDVEGVISGDGSGLLKVDAATLGGHLPAYFVRGGQGCGTGEYVSGIDASGDVTCAALADYVNANCVLYLGWIDNCDGCTTAPAKWGKVRPGGCANGLGADNTCQSSSLGGESIDLFGLNPDGAVDGSDKFFLGFKCF